MQSSQGITTQITNSLEMFSATNPKSHNTQSNKTTNEDAF